MMREVRHDGVRAGYHRSMSVRRILALAAGSLLLAPQALLAAGGAAPAASSTSWLTLAEIALALVVLAIILAAARHARANVRPRDEVWIPPSWNEETP